LVVTHIYNTFEVSDTGKGQKKRAIPSRYSQFNKVINYSLFQLKTYMSNLQFSNQVLNFWALNFTNDAIIVGSDLLEGTIEVTDGDFENFLESIHRIGSFYNDYTQDDDTYTYEEFMAETDLYEIDNLLDEYLKDKLSTMDANEYETFTQSMRSSDMYDSIPMPTEAQAAAQAGSQRVCSWEDLQEERELI